MKIPTSQLVPTSMPSDDFTAAAFVRPQLIDRLVSSLAPDRILLFGSRARSLEQPRSDIDLLLVGTWSMETRQALRHARHLVRDWIPRVDLVLCTPSEMDEARTGHSPFLRSILEAGILLYRR